MRKIYTKMKQSSRAKHGWWPMRHNFMPPEYEICVGAILTQNTNWNNVEKALENLSKEKIKTPKQVRQIRTAKLQQLIKPAGFFKQKSLYLKELSRLLISFTSFNNFKKNVTREQLLNVRGIGPETCDSILLYACSRPYFVIDAYTKRTFRRLGILEYENYENVRRKFESQLPRNVKLYKEFHALIVEHAKKFCRAKPLCDECFLRNNCQNRPKP